jgi:hypothetical protein
VGLIKKILWFVGGKPPEIIFEKGEVSHKHPDSKWKEWEARFNKNPDYDWRKHTATNWDRSKPSVKK